MNDKEPMVSIPLEKYRELLEQAHILRCLEQAGVDNWEGYSYAQELM